MFLKQMEASIHLKMQIENIQFSIKQLLPWKYKELKVNAKLPNFIQTQF